MHVTYPVGAGPIINSVGIARHSSGDPTIAITTYLNPPNWVAAYNASSGTDSPSPMWTLSPSTPFSPSTIYFVDCARHQDDSGDKTSAVDRFSLLSEDNEYTGCTIRGSASNAGAGAALELDSPVVCCLFGAGLVALHRRKRRRIHVVRSAV